MPIHSAYPPFVLAICGSELLHYQFNAHARAYKKGEGSLSVFTNGAETSKLRIEIEEKNKQLQTIINGLASENMELKSKIAKVENEVAEIKKIMEKLI